MKRATITVSSDIEDALEAYLHDQEAVPSLTAVVQTALRDFLLERGYLAPSKPFRITPAPNPSGKRDVSLKHDKYLAEAVYARSRSGLSEKR